MTCTRASTLGLLTLLAFAPWLNAKPIYEAYYRVEKQGKHNGYLIQRVDESSDGKTLTLTSYTRTKQGEDEVARSMRVSVNARTGRPLSSNWRGNDVGGPVEIIAKFNGKGGGTSTTSNYKFKKVRKTDTIAPTDFASTTLFLFSDFARMARDKEYRFYAYAEDDGQTRTGVMKRLGERKIGDAAVMHVLTDYSGVPVENFVSTDGVPLAARAPASDVFVYWVPDRAAAVGTFEYPDKQIKTLFKREPKGDVSPWAALPEFRAENEVENFQRLDPKKIFLAGPVAHPVLAPMRARR